MSGARAEYDKDTLFAMHAKYNKAITSPASTNTSGVTLMLGLQDDNRIRPSNDTMPDSSGIANMPGLRAVYDEETLSSASAEDTTEIATHKNWSFPRDKDVASHDAPVIVLKIKPERMDVGVEKYLRLSRTIENTSAREKKISTTPSAPAAHAINVAFSVADTNVTAFELANSSRRRTHRAR